MPKNINYFSIITTLEGIEEIYKNWKKNLQQNSLKSISSTNDVRKHQTL